MNTREGYAELQARILAARRVWKRSLFWTGFAIVLTGVVALVAGEAIVDWLMPLPSPCPHCIVNNRCRRYGLLTVYISRSTAPSVTHAP